MSSIFIILLNWNGKEDTLACLRSLEKIQEPLFETIVIDNGSEDNSVEEIKKAFPLITLIETKENLGFAEGNNVGIRFALEKKASHILLLNNDTIVDPTFLHSLMLFSRNHPDGAILGATIYQMQKPDSLDCIGGFYNSKTANFIPISDKSAHPRKMDYVSGCALFASRNVFEKVGLLEKDFFLLWEESDFCCRAKKKGFPIISVPEAKIFHKGSASFVGGKPHLQYFWWRNRLLFIKRNIEKKEKRALFFLLFTEIFHTYKIYFLKKIEKFLIQTLLQKPFPLKKEKNLLRYKASCMGISDYFRKRFGNCPKALFVEMANLKKLEKTYDCK